MILFVNSLADEENGLVPSHGIQNGIGDEIDANGFRNGTYRAITHLKTIPHIK